MNNKGFTLIELIATIVILGIVMSIATYSITSIIKKTKDESYSLLIKNIKDGAEMYYQECKYSDNSGISCNKSGNYYVITLGDLVSYGYIKPNSDDNGTNYTIVNPNDEVNISGCQIRISYSSGNFLVEPVSSDGSCPTAY